MGELIGKNNTLTSTSTTEALTAAQGKELQDKKLTYAMGTMAPTSSSFVEDNSVYIQYGDAGLSSAVISAILNAVYPVGCYYWSSDSTNPGTLFGGTWTQIKDRFVLAAGDTYTVGDTGGAASVTSGGTTLTTDQIPAHTHGSKSLTGFAKFRTTSSGGGRLFAGLSGIVSETYTDSSAEYATLAVYGSGTNNKPSQRLTVNATHEHTSVGGGAAHSHTVSTMSPYIVAYCWRRTA